MSIEPRAPRVTHDDFDALDALLDDLRTRGEDVPQWEFCDGALTAALCTRRAIGTDEMFPLLLGTEDILGDTLAGLVEPSAGKTGFADEAQRHTFEALWLRRCADVTAGLDSGADTLDDANGFHPEVMDVRGAVGLLPETERAAMSAHPLPAFGQVWALGFMFVVENWPDEWAAPRDKELAQWLNDSLDAIVALTEDDTDPPTVCMHNDDGLPSVSQARVRAYGAAIWAVYDLRQLWRTLGPRTVPASSDRAVGRNDPCWCGSGKKFKKCHGAN